MPCEYKIGSRVKIKSNDVFMVPFVKEGKTPKRKFYGIYYEDKVGVVIEEPIDFDDETHCIVEYGRLFKKRFLIDVKDLVAV